MEFDQMSGHPKIKTIEYVGPTTDQFITNQCYWLIDPIELDSRIDFYLCEVFDELGESKVLCLSPYDNEWQFIE